ncbi:unnamed protein product [Spirodela intermedia]|uniref:Condensin-2 complex subunit H2 n=1 Tax=Spirodela intermedia TaxID=51605 RepID=A0A7I8JGP6_SPIIN|nr:unnamed protein product [Spirodela intermedia]CAA6668713.1 unnamed protein product [Spirodela intermedia]
MRDEEWGSKEAGPAVTGSGGGDKFQMLQPNRDLEVNWTVDLAKNLEEYLLKICSGEIDADGEELGHLSVNFAEGLQSEVEYLYTLVLHALEFLSRDKHDQNDKSPPQPDGMEDSRVIPEDDEIFLGLDDVPVETKNCLDDEDNEDDFLNHLLKPPANLNVLEGDCLDTISEASKFESYLLSTCSFYGDFLLLDPCDAEAVHNFISDKDKVKERSVTHRASMPRMNAQSSLHFPSEEQSAVKSHKPTGMKQDVAFDQPFESNFASGVGLDDTSSGPNAGYDSPENDGDHQDEPEFGYPDINDDSDEDDDPWKPLNPHEAGNLRIKPFKRCSIFRRKLASFNKREPVVLQFPVAKLDGTIDPELAEMFSKQLRAQASVHSSQSPPFFEKLRESLVWGKHEAYDVLHDLDDENNDAEDDNDIMDSTEKDDINLTQNSINFDAEVPLNDGKQSVDTSEFNRGETFGKNDVDTEKSLEDLCRSHLDSLLASIVEAEKQTEIATRVSTWKQKIEHTLNEQDSHCPFDIHLYGEKILSKLSVEADDEMSMCFTSIVTGQAKHDIARTFSALLQLVNDGTLDLDRGDSSTQSTCFTSANAFQVRLVNPERKEELQIPRLKKRIKSPPSRKPPKPDDSEKYPLRSGKKGGVRCTPEGKKRRRSGLVDLPSAR